MNIMMSVRRVTAKVDWTFDTSDDPEFHMNTKSDKSEKEMQLHVQICVRTPGGSRLSG